MEGCEPLIPLCGQTHRENSEGTATRTLYTAHLYLSRYKRSPSHAPAMQSQTLSERCTTPCSRLPEAQKSSHIIIVDLPGCVVEHPLKLYTCLKSSNLSSSKSKSSAFSHIRTGEVTTPFSPTLMPALVPNSGSRSSKLIETAAHAGLSVLSRRTPVQLCVERSTPRYKSDDLSGGGAMRAEQRVRIASVIAVCDLR